MTQNPFGGDKHLERERTAGTHGQDPMARDPITDQGRESGAGHAPPSDTELDDIGATDEERERRARQERGNRGPDEEPSFGQKV